MTRLIVKDGQIVYEDTGMPISERRQQVEYQPRPSISRERAESAFYGNSQSVFYSRIMNHDGFMNALRALGIKVEP